MILSAGHKGNVPILFLHGFMGTPRDFLRLMLPLSKNFYCLSIPLPGHSSLYKGNLSKKIFYDHMAEILKSLDQKAHLVGYSMGGRSALEFTKIYPKLIDTLILESTHFGLQSSSERQMRLRSDQKLFYKYDHLQDFLDEWYSRPLFKGFKDLEKYKHLTSSIEDFEACLKVYSLGHQEDLKKFFIDTPRKKLYIAGKNDLKFSQIGYSLPENISVRIVKDTSHNVHMMAPSVVERMIEDILLH